MADVRCPHCNSFNPAGAEKCWNCEASLLSGEPTQASIDWLSDLRSGVASQDEGQDDEIEDILGDEDETPDWLKRIRQRSQSEQEFEGSGDLSASSSDDLPDWLIDLQSQPLDEGAASRLGDDAIPPPPGGIDTTGWFQELPGLESGKEAAGGIEDIPTWLLEPPAEPEAEKPSADETAVFSGDLPDWLSAVQKPDQDRADASQAQELPSWLFADEKEERLPEIDSEPGLAAETPVYGTAPNQFEILSHGDRGAQLPVEETPATQEIFDEPVQAYAQDQDAEEADQVSELATSKAFQPGAVEEPAAAVVEEEPDLSVTAFEMDALPDWLAGESVDLPQAEPAASTPAFTVGGEEGLEEPVIEQVHPFSNEEIPAWLTVDEHMESEEPESEDLARTALPNWVEAMRPVETVALSGAAALAAEQYIEKAGPLAGLTGILPVDIAAVDYDRPPTYSMRLRVSDKQRASAALLETVLEEEGKPKDLQRENPGFPQVIFRLLIGILLIAVIILSDGMAGVTSQGTGSNSISAIDFGRQLDALPIGRTILVAVEFDPGYSSEMTMTGMGVMERLLARDNRLVMVSTALAGPVLADELVTRASSTAFALDEKVTNLGFLPGGIISLKEFSLAPQVAARYGMDWVHTGQSAWQAPPLQDIQQITDFSLVLVMTDSGDTGRMWIEQISPHLGDVPLMMVTTAQAAPILSPYLAGGQLDGLISGLSGGRSFGSVSLANQIEDAWVAFRAGILVTVALILLGTLLRGIYSMIPGAKSS